MKPTAPNSIRALLALVVLTAFGCGSDLLGPTFEQGLTHLGGCADVVFFAVDDADETMVTFETAGLVAEAQAAGRETETVIALPAAGVRLIVGQGSRISDATCDDVIENGGPRVERIWMATSGTATVRIRPSGLGSGGRGDLILEDIVFSSDGEEPVTMDRLEWLDVSVGWFPG